MLAVNVRELKNRLSRYLQDVKHGERILVTDRGQVVAEIHQPFFTQRFADPVLAALDAASLLGHIKVGTFNDPLLYGNTNIHVPSGTAAQLLNLERNDDAEKLR